MPSPGESISTVIIASWLAEDGSFVEKDQEIAEIDSDKATLSIVAEVSGVLSILVAEGSQAGVGDVIARIAPGEAEAPSASSPKGKKESSDRGKDKSEAAQDQTSKEKDDGDVEATSDDKSGDAGKGDEEIKAKGSADSPDGGDGRLPLSPLARAFMDAEGLTEEQVMERLKGKRIRRSDLKALFRDEGDDDRSYGLSGEVDEPRHERREPMTPLRLKLSQRLVSVKNETAMLTTFNEVDMHALLAIREKYGKPFQERHGIRLGMMAFFTRAATIALQEFPKVNASIQGDDIIYHNYTDISIAVSGPKGLVVPVVRNTHRMTIAEIEAEIRRLAEKASKNRLTLDEMTGGTFTISNGGVFGSMLSTPILNPPQSAILGMHNIVERPVAVDGQVVVRPVMYVALSYDHRMIDGKESVGFLMRIKEMIENPLAMITAGNPYEKLLDL